jgi:transposase
MTHFVGLDVSQRTTAICVLDKDGRRIWRGQCPSVPEQIDVAVRRYAGEDVRIGIETGAMTPWLVHELRYLGREVICLDARHARAALKMQINKTDQNDAEGLAQIVRTGWYRSVHVKSFDSHRARASANIGPMRFETMPSRPIQHAWRKITAPVSSDRPAELDTIADGFAVPGKQLG